MHLSSPFQIFLTISPFPFSPKLATKNFHLQFRLPKTWRFGWWFHGVTFGRTPGWFKGLADIVSRWRRKRRDVTEAVWVGMSWVEHDFFGGKGVWDGWLVPLEEFHHEFANLSKNVFLHLHNMNDCATLRKETNNPWHDGCKQFKRSWDHCL